jgi:hypothetical protein
MDNKTAIKNGINKARKIIDLRMMAGLMIEVDKLAFKAYESYRSTFMGFTGNAWTGTVVGLYFDKKLVYNKSTREIASMPKALMRKLTLGEAKYLKEPYGTMMDATGAGGRKFFAIVPTDKKYAEESALDFLNSYVPSQRFEIVVVNGAEYASYIERTMGGDVISGTYHYARTLKANV